MTSAVVRQECDLIMKGGISSGIVYPRAAAALSGTYTFRQVGGASAGAIAAAAVAAAEHGRDRGGFTKLEDLPTQLGTRLGGLFQAGPSTRPVFRVLSGWLEPSWSRPRKLRVTATTVAAQAPRPFLLTLAILLGVPLTAVLVAGHPTWWLVVVCAVLWVPAAAVAAVILSAVTFGRHALDVMTTNGFGMCDGHTQDPATNQPPLTDWMTSTFDDLAGLTGTDGPLTFGDLWGTDAVDLAREIAARERAGERPSSHAVMAAAAARTIDLQVMTTCLTFQRPYRFPFSASSFAFCPVHLGQYFPDTVVAHMMATSEPSAPQQDLVDGAAVPIPMVCPTHAVPLRDLPPAWDLPVVVAARLSLSFPGLISAVPFFTVDRARTPGNRHVIPVWFSDGGLSSNFPMHFFDSPFPGRPTFGIDLSPVDPDDPNDLVWKPSPQGQGEQPPQATPMPTMVAFGRTILDTMQSWVDNTQITMPGFRDRIVTIRQKRGEGGMNLKMAPETITALADRGALAGARLLDFDLPLHRWIRYRVAMSGADDMLDALQAKYQNGFHAFIDDYGPTATHYAIGDPTRVAADAQATAHLMSLAQAWDAQDNPGAAGDLPSPRPDLRFAPRQ